ncbi:MAG: ATP-binding protein, partial [Candidatus Hodarchaeota archaeon]
NDIKKLLIGKSEYRKTYNPDTRKKTILKKIPPISVPKNIFIELERYIQDRIVKPHTMEIDEDQKDVSNLLQPIFPSKDGLYIGNLLYGDTKVFIPVKYLPYHISIFGITGSGKSNLMQDFIDSAIRYNMKQLFGSTTSRQQLVSILAIDPHDEYAFGTEERGAGLQHIIELLDPAVARDLMGDFYYLYPNGTSIPGRLSQFSRAILINYEEIMPIDLLNVISFTPQQAELLLATHGQNHETWINDILTGTNLPAAHEQTVPAVRRRLRAIERSRIFRAGGSSSLLDIIDALETGKILDFNASLLTDFEQFLFNTVVARTIFNIRKALKSSTTINEFQNQLRIRLPNPLYEQFISSQDRLGRYISSGNEVKDPKDMPIVMITIEEAPSLLNPQMMRGQNVFKNISRQGRKFNVGLCVISQQITTLDPAIMSNLNTMIHLPIGSDYERTAAIKNATSGITNNDLKSLEGTIGIAIISGIWLTNFQKIQIPLYKPYFDENKKEFEDLSSGGPQISI